MASRNHNREQHETRSKYHVLGLPAVMTHTYLRSNAIVPHGLYSGAYVDEHFVGTMQLGDASARTLTANKAPTHHRNNIAVAHTVSLRRCARCMCPSHAGGDVRQVLQHQRQQLATVFAALRRCAGRVCAERGVSFVSRQLLCHCCQLWLRRKPYTRVSYQHPLSSITHSARSPRVCARSTHQNHNQVPNTAQKPSTLAPGPGSLAPSCAAEMCCSECSSCTHSVDAAVVRWR
jgi:hypothetical protein